MGGGGIFVVKCKKMCLILESSTHCCFCFYVVYVQVVVWFGPWGLFLCVPRCFQHILLLFCALFLSCLLGKNLLVHFYDQH